MKKTTLYTDLENVNLDNIIISSLKKTPKMDIVNITYNYNDIQNMLSRRMTSQSASSCAPH